MHSQLRRRDSKAAIALDRGDSNPFAANESYQVYQDFGPLAHSEPRGQAVPMSEYEKTPTFGVYEYHTARRPSPAHDYRSFAATYQAYPASYGGPPSQVPSGLPQLAATSHTPTAHQYSPHDPSHYAPQNVQYSGYVDTTAASRPLPEVISYSPVHGQAGTKVTIRLRSGHDLDSPSMTPVIMFGQKRCPGFLSRTTSQPSTSFDYSLTTEAPPLTPTSTPSPQFPLVLTFEDSSVNGQALSTEFGKFTYLDDATFQQPIHSTPRTGTMRKRKLDAEASPRRSPTKKPSMHNLSAAAGAYRQPAPSSPVQLRNAGEPYSHTRRFSGPDFQQQTFQQPPHKLRAARSMYFPSAQPTPSLHAPPTPTWSQMGDPQQQGRLYGMNKTSIVPLPSPNPSLVRTSTLQQSPTMPSAAIAQPQFNPYAMMYPSKAALKLEGDLNSMTYKWTAEEWEAGRRLVQFRRSQQGSTISASFEAVTLEDRIPNSICVSCIWWAEKEECFVTSVDTISLLESLVSVRFTVEEKNRIRRNLEGFRPLTVSKTKQDSDDFFKLIMGFPNPKPRNIEKDVKVFPWRILATALKKIIGKYSASYASTAGALHGPGQPEHQQQRLLASPLSTSSGSAASHGQAYASSMASAYPMNPMATTGLGIVGLSQPTMGGPPLSDLRMTPVNQSTTWRVSPHHYSGQHMSERAAPWELSDAFAQPSPQIGLPTPSMPTSRPPQLPFSAHHQHPPALSLPLTPRFVPLENYGGQNQQTSNA
ncbi:hypothetical protein BDY17DRAFT_38429 [Neohortaea acidophila]|uniref:DUF7082 domain-containing protein n=1 Tax=Neohortaea acidophila TaxID=245834 RepID=A0A6A6PIS8_9PEZI|nr:uncharacterized protein BDY17DRAFT_38429 [Neohortaea acidophila]KAF2479433.1 hypothetical protein BDY17DRAFT_38429 [Neohortaea acidophila]